MKSTVSMSRKVLVWFGLCALLLNAPLDAENNFWSWEFETLQKREVAASSGGVAGKHFAAPEELCRLAPGIAGKGLEISGAKPTDRAVGGMAIPALPLDWTKGFTVLVSVKFSPLLAEKEHFKTSKYIIGNSGVRGPGWLLYLTWGRLHLRTGDGKKPAGISIPFDGYGRWRQIGVTYDGKIATIYLDGAPVLSEPLVITAAERKGLFVGSANGSGCQLYGTIDNLQIFDHPVPAPEIAENWIKQMP